MKADKTGMHGIWASRLTFILAATGSAVGLGNIWKFPYITGENGGGAFVVVYFGCGHTRHDCRSLAWASGADESYPYDAAFDGEWWCAFFQEYRLDGSRGRVSDSIVL